MAGRVVCLRQDYLVELETSLIKHYSANGVFTDYGKVGGQAVPKHSVIDFGRSSGRGVKKDGYYLFTIDEGIETHGVIIQKLTHSSGTTFYLFDPNGKKWSNTKLEHTRECTQNGGMYGICVRYGGNIYLLDRALTPSRSWNSTGNCYIWNLIMLVILQELPDRVTDVLETLSIKYDKTTFIAGEEVVTVGDSFIIDFTDKIQKKRGILQDYHKFIQEVRKAVLEII